MAIARNKAFCVFIFLNIYIYSTGCKSECEIQYKTERKQTGTSSGNIHLTMSVYNLSETNKPEKTTSSTHGKLNVVLEMVLIALPF